ncbi:sugar O-acetyltransferase [Pelagicoccus sp. NFK12]|uniref:Acetyltransferase n=1 Tax=Pelagicoccus enzymogenes TaxID=2773457 RepID=A0A927F9J2_9BACT|nr:sugar O-acetyltransferase [Pelagicoccus enzymogenes]MBD5780355.1 sugar O-acetyltransferase [Pelagicoccus enzymogenes]MDQ8197742.1 sugar O-acetyltransferase [Pelagicoccus enzymogenes]
MPTEKEKMIAGEPYVAMDQELASERLAARQAIHRYNASAPEQFKERAQILERLLGAYHKTAFIEPEFRCDYGYNIHLGKAFYANFGCVMLDVCPITIGEYVKFGPNVQLYTAAHPIDPDERATFTEFGKPITIGDKVWIGGSTIVLPGVTIGEGTTIGAGSVVTKPMPPRVVAAGNPCRVIREI